MDQINAKQLSKVLNPIGVYISMPTHHGEMIRLWNHDHTKQIGIRLIGNKLGYTCGWAIAWANVKLLVESICEAKASSFAYLDYPHYGKTVVDNPFRGCTSFIEMRIHLDLAVER